MPTKRKRPVLDPAELHRNMAERKEAKIAKEIVAAGFICTSCGKKHDNYHSDLQHGLCTKCRDDAFERSRRDGRCCRCGSTMTRLTPHKADALDRDRYLGCLSCGLVISLGKNDAVRGSSRVHS